MVHNIESDIFCEVIIGNRHLVVFVENFDFDIVERGRDLQQGNFGTYNINFVRIDSKSSIMVRTFEYGSGLTNSCGSGS